MDETVLVGGLEVDQLDRTLWIEGVCRKGLASLVKKDKGFACSCPVHQEMEPGQIVVPVGAEDNKPLCLFTAD